LGVADVGNAHKHSQLARQIDLQQVFAKGCIATLVKRRKIHRQYLVLNGE